MKIWHVIFLFVGILGFVGANQRGRKVTESPTDSFHSWKRVNSKPVWILGKFDALCTGPTLAQTKIEKADPHVHKYITVYVNAVGERAMNNGSVFPVGSVIVKEKHRSGDGSVDMSTVMIKRQRGYNPQCGDWAFATLDSTGKSTTSAGKIPSCIGCHKPQIKLDYTFRTYLPGATRDVSTGGVPGPLSWRRG